MTPDDLDLYEQKAKRALEIGPFEMWPNEGGGEEVWFGHGATQIRPAGAHLSIWIGDERREQSRPDIEGALAEFIRATLTEAPALCAALRAAWAERERYRNFLDAMLENIEDGDLAALPRVLIDTLQRQIESALGLVEPPTR